MNIYKTFVLYDKLISPVNGYECRVITKQNIKQFGFNTKEELLLDYPKFPLLCKKTSDFRSEKAKIEHKNGHNTKIHKIKNKIKFENYIPKLCKKCKTEISFIKRYNTFCSQKCSNSHEYVCSTETKIKISNSMKLLHSEKPKVLLEFNCSICNNIVYRKKPNKTNTYSCKNCIKFFKIKQVQKIAHLGGIKGGKASAAKQVRRSKLEIKLYELCKPHFNLQNNIPIANGWDADILLMDYKIAILWNGPWHYKEMNFGTHSLSQVVNRDVIKIIEFEKIGWEVLIYEDNKWTPEEAFIGILLKLRSMVMLQFSRI
jgi:hypothetical protein